MEPSSSFFEKYTNYLKKEMIMEENDEELDIDDIKSELLQKSPFLLPIEYHNHDFLSESLRSDIEFQGDANLIQHIMKSKGNHPSLLIDKWSSIYTTHKGYLKDNQTLLKSYKQHKNDMDSFISSYVDFKSEQNFLSKYQYIQFRRFFFLNSITGFLQFLALYNICSPLFSLLSPFLGLIVPYFIFYFKGIRMSFSDYLKMVKSMILNTTIIKNILHFKKDNLQQKMYSVVYLFFYGLSIYNNIQSCIQFYHNTHFMIDFNSNYFSFLCKGDELIDHLYEQTKSLPSFQAFNMDLLTYKSKIGKIKHSIGSLNNVELYMKYGQIGLLMKTNFEMFYNEENHNCIMYLTYLHEYHRNMTDLSHLVHTKKLNRCSFLKDKSSKPTKLKKMYYIAHQENAIQNDICFDKNIIITGPNASGKTTLIKSVIINLFLSQSIGFGCYKKCKTKLYDSFHSYLNIPDTSNRDSLFQAEARRCKDIFEYIKKNNKKRHLCIFDEIYSGTNPQDAVLCADLYLKSMNQYKYCVDFVLTTHYLDLCSKFDNDESSIKNQQMTVIHQDKENIKYTYLLKDGISEVHGGYQVLKDLDYPEEIMNIDKQK